MQTRINLRLYTILLVLILVLLPAQAQEVTDKRIGLDDFSFILSPDIATNANVMQFPGDPIGEVYPGGPQPPHTRILLYNEPPAPAFFLQSRATISVYPLTDMEEYTAHRQIVEVLERLLTERPNLSEFEQTRDSLSEITLPFLPILPGAQVIRARAEYVQTDTIDGIAYVTVYRQGVAPFLASEFIYTFQGLSADCEYFVSLIMPIHATMFANTLSADYDPEAFIATMNDYFADSIDALKDGNEADFEPNLSFVKALVESIVFSDSRADILSMLP